MKTGQLQMLDEAGCFLSVDSLQIDLDDLLRTNINGYSRDVVSETVVEESLRTQLSTSGVYKCADAITAI